MIRLISIYPSGVSYLREAKDNMHIALIVETCHTAKHFILEGENIGVAMMNSDIPSIDEEALSVMADSARQLFLLAELELTKH